MVQSHREHVSERSTDGVDEGEFEDPDKETIVAVLGKKYGNIDQYSEEEQQIFQAYHKRFQLGSKPTAHLAPLAEISDSDLVDDIPGFIDRLIDSVEASLEELPE